MNRTNAMKEKKSALVACIVLEKAFDTVNHDALLIEMAKLGLKGNLINWKYSFLRERTIQIEKSNQKLHKRNNLEQSR